jgi:hypothetical protein
MKVTVKEALLSEILEDMGKLQDGIKQLPSELTGVTVKVDELANRIEASATTLEKSSKVFRFSIDNYIGESLKTYTAALEEAVNKGYEKLEFKRNVVLDSKMEFLRWVALLNLFTTSALIIVDFFTNK